MQQVRRRGRSRVMRMSFLEWAARVAMLVLAGMVTLSILGSIAAISNEAPPGRPGAAPGDLPPRAVRPAAEAPSRAPAPEASERQAAQSAAPAAAEPAAGAIVAAGAEPGAREDRWLEAIAYALLALAGLLAIAVLLLWNGLR